MSDSTISLLQTLRLTNRKQPTDDQISYLVKSEFFEDVVDLEYMYNQSRCLTNVLPVVDQF